VFWYAVILPDTAKEHLTCWMGMDVDETRDQTMAGAIDYLVGCTVVILSNEDDLVPVADEVSTANIGVALNGLVPRDDPIGIFKMGCAHVGLLMRKTG